MIYKLAQDGFLLGWGTLEEMIKMQDDQYPFATISLFKNVKLGE